MCWSACLALQIQRERFYNHVSCLLSLFLEYPFRLSVVPHFPLSEIRESACESARERIGETRVTNFTRALYLYYSWGNEGVPVI